MNSLEVAFIQSPISKEEECSLFKIENTENPFVLHDIAVLGTEYTLTFWIKSDDEGSIQFLGVSYDVTPEWTEHAITFTADDVNLIFTFQMTGRYYMYHPKLEVGNKSTDWSPAPEDAVDDIASVADTIDETTSIIRTMSESLSELSVKADSINASVSSVEQRYDELNEELTLTKKEITTFKIESDGIYAEVKSIVDDGATKVTTTSGTFDKDGLTIDNNDSETKTTVTPDGMVVYMKTHEGDGEELTEVLTATSFGVTATNLHANTYLIINDRSRFESYGKNRTGCFWIGG